MLKNISETFQEKISNIQKDGKPMNSAIMNHIAEDLVRDLEIDAFVQDIAAGLVKNPKYYIFRDVYGRDFDTAVRNFMYGKELSKNEFKSFNKGLMMASESYYQNGLRVYDTLIRAFYRANKNYNIYRSKYGSGCYIATAAYGSYNHPQVLKLRYFRDEKLDTSIIGKIIIKIYYVISPFFVKCFGKSVKFNRAMQLLLDKFIQKYID